MKESPARFRFETRLIHSGEPSPRYGKAVVPPVFQSSTFEFSGSETDPEELRYLRLNNTPNHVVLHEKLAALEGAEAGLVTASGMAAISAALLSVLRSGDHFLVQEGLYGGTHGLINTDLRALGIEHDVIEAGASATWEARLRPNTRAIYVETISNPLLRVPELEAVAAFARAKGLVSVIDNTFASPVNFRPIERGFDLVVHSCTKYLNGHSDIVAGAVLGSRTRVAEVTRKLNHLGGSLDPHACFLLHRGLKTLSVRLKHQNAAALRIAAFLQSHPGVSEVHYPGLASHPEHERAKALFDGFGGMLSFRLEGGLAAAERLFARLRLPIPAPSLGGVETLITLPSRTSHRGLGVDGRRLAGIGEDLIRLSVGLESPEDLIEDFDQAISGRGSKA